MAKTGALKALDLNPTLNAAQFQGRFDLWLRQHEAEKPFGKLRELEARIAEGNRRLALAENSGNAGGEDYERGVVKLAALRTERDELRKTAQIPHFFMASVHNLLRASRGWGLPAGSKISVEIPGVFDMAVDLAESEVPFQVADVIRPRQWREVRDAKFTDWRNKYRPKFDTETRQLKDGFDGGFEAAWDLALGIVAELVDQ